MQVILWYIFILFAIDTDSCVYLSFALPIYTRFLCVCVVTQVFIHCIDFDKQNTRLRKMYASIRWLADFKSWRK